jgi:hypothetical protein
MYQCSATLTTVPTTWLPDDVWRQLDPRQARLTKRARRGVAAAMASTAVATILVALGVASGELGGSLWLPTWDITINRHTHTFVESVSIENESWFDETITGAATGAPHVRVTDVNPARLTIPHGQTRTLRLRFQVTNCDTLPRGDAVPIVHLERFWGTQSVTLQVLPWTHGLEPGSYPLANGPAWEACGKY